MNHQTSTESTDPGHTVVVGAGPGIGAGVARRFAAAGHRLTLVARDGDRLQSVAGPLRDAGAAVTTITADAGDPYGLRAALTPAFADCAPAVLVYNAALNEGDDLLDSDQTRLESAYAVNVVGAIVAAQLAAPLMRAGGGGTILFTGGHLADDPGPEWGTLSLGKVTLRAVAVILAKQLAAVPVHVANVTIAGDVAGGGPFDPDRIGDAYWRIHAEPVEVWRTDYLFDGKLTPVATDR